MTEIRGLSGKPVTDLTLEAVRAGEVSVADLRIHPETLERQALVAEQHGNPQLADNLRRAAELTELPDDDVLGIYEALRPGRSTAATWLRWPTWSCTRSLPRSRRRFTACSVPTLPATPRAAPPTRPATPTPTRPSRLATTPP